MTPPAPPGQSAHQILSPALSQLEAALENLHEVWLLCRGSKQTEQANSSIRSLWAVLDPVLRMYAHTEDPVGLLANAQRELPAFEGTLDQLHGAPWLAHAKRLVADTSRQLQEAVTRLRYSQAVLLAPPSLKASLGTPALQRGTATPLLPKLAVEPAPPQPSVPSSTHPPEGFDKDALPVLTKAQWVEFHARDCFADIVAMLPQRTPQLGEAWAMAEIIEQRLLANLDGLASLGDAGYRSLETIVEQALVIDAPLCAGLALVTGSLWGRDGLALCERFLLTWETDDAMWQAAADAWKLSPNPWLEALCAHYLKSRDLRKVRLGIAVMGYRSWLTVGELERLQRRNDVPLDWWLPHLHVLPLATRHDVLRGLYTRHQTPVGEPQLWWASALCGYPPTPTILEQAAPNDDSGEGWLLLALYGERRHAEQLLAVFQTAPTPALARALGWAGVGKAIPVMIAALVSDDPTLKEAIAAGLERVTGAGLFEEVVIPAEQAMDADVPEPTFPPEGAPTLASEVNDPRDAPAEASLDTVVLPAVSHETWSAYWKENQNRFAADTRYRQGAQASPAVFATELRDAQRTPRDRRLIHSELVMRTGRRVQFDPDQWVPEQRVALEQWLQIASGCVVTAGTWFRLAPVD